jgi:hypothetical protein
MEFDSRNFASLVRAAGSFITTQLRLVGEQLANADLNPHEGKLRASTYMTEENIPNLVPDFPPTDLEQ